MVVGGIAVPMDCDIWMETDSGKRQASDAISLHTWIKLTKMGEERGERFKVVDLCDDITQ